MRIFFDNRFQIFCAVFALGLPGIAVIIADPQSGQLTTNTEVILSSLGMACLVPYFANKAAIAKGKGSKSLAGSLLIIALCWAGISIYAGVSFWQ
jgi:hypothetical protein